MIFIDIKEVTFLAELKNFTRDSFHVKDQFSALKNKKTRLEIVKNGFLLLKKPF